MAVIAFIGLGQMGSPMASNLLKQGHQLSVFDVNPDAVQRPVEKGAQPASSPAQAVKGRICHHNAAKRRSGAQRTVR